MSETIKTKLSKAEYQKEYYAKHKEKLLEIARTQICCELCGRTITKNNYNTHVMSRICINTQNRKILFEERKQLLKNII